MLRNYRKLFFVFIFSVTFCFIHSYKLILHCFFIKVYCTQIISFCLFTDKFLLMFIYCMFFTDHFQQKNQIVFLPPFPLTSFLTKLSRKNKKTDFRPSPAHAKPISRTDRKILAKIREELKTQNLGSNLYSVNTLYYLSFVYLSLIYILYYLFYTIYLILFSLYSSLYNNFIHNILVSFNHH